MNVMSRAIHPLPVIAAACGLLVNSAMAQVEPVTYLTTSSADLLSSGDSGSSTRVSSSEGQDPDPPLIVDRHGATATINGKSMTTSATLPEKTNDIPSTGDNDGSTRVSSSEGADMDPPSTVDIHGAKPTTDREEGGGEPLKKPTATQQSLQATSTPKTSKGEPSPELTTGTDPESSENTFTDPKLTVHAKESTRGGWAGGTPSDAETSFPSRWKTTVIEGQSKPTDCIPDPDHNIEAHQSSSTDENPSSVVETTSTSTEPPELITSKVLPTPASKNPTTGTGPPEPIINKPAPTPSYRGSVTSIPEPSSTEGVTIRDIAPASEGSTSAIPARSMNTLAGESAYPPVTLDKAPATLGEDPDHTPDIASISPLAQGPVYTGPATTDDPSPNVYPTVEGTQPTSTVFSGITRASPLSEASSRFKSTAMIDSMWTVNPSSVSPDTTSGISPPLPNPSSASTPAGPVTCQQRRHKLLSPSQCSRSSSYYSGCFIQRPL